MGGIRRQRKGKMGDGGDMGRNKERERKGKWVKVGTWGENYKDRERWGK